MTARNLHLAGDPAAPIQTSLLHGISLPWVVRNLLFLSLTMALLQYALHSSLGIFIHLVLLYAAGLAVLAGRKRKERIQGLLGGGALLMAAMLFSEAISYISGDQYSTDYGALFIGVIIAARLIVQEIGIPGVIRAYSQAALVTVVSVLILGGRSLSSDRFSGGTDVHPNLLAFILAGFFFVLIWRALEYRVSWRRWTAGVLALLDFVFIFYTGSRGALAAILITGIVLAARKAASGPWLRQIRIRHWHVIAVMVAIPLVAAYLLQHGRLQEIGDSLNTSLALNNSQRGLKSGFSGRTSFWRAAFALLALHNRWLFGFGYRAGDRLVGTIDSGYVQLLFESGLISGSIIMASILRVLVLLWRASKPQENNAWTRYYTVLTAMMMVYMLNNISTRYLFSYGSSFSIVVIMMMTTSRRELVGNALERRNVRPRATAPVRPRAGIAWTPSER